MTQTQIDQILRDASEIRSSWGFLLMRGFVAANEQDFRAVLKREFEEHADAFERLERSIPLYGSAEWHALAADGQQGGRPRKDQHG